MTSKISCRRKSLEFSFHFIWAHYLTKDVVIRSRWGLLEILTGFSRHKRKQLTIIIYKKSFLFVDDLGATKLQMGWTVTIGRLQIVQMYSSIQHFQKKICLCLIFNKYCKKWHFPSLLSYNIGQKNNNTIEFWSLFIKSTVLNVGIKKCKGYCISWQKIKLLQNNHIFRHGDLIAFPHLQWTNHRPTW